MNHFPTLLTASASFLLLTICTPTLHAGVDFTKQIVEVTATPGSKEVHGEFKCRNTGKAPVKIRHISTSCGCTSAKADKKILAPGEEATIDAGMRVDRRPGLRFATITVETDDGTKTRTVLSLVARVKPA